MHAAKMKQSAQEQKNLIDKEEDMGLDNSEHGESINSNFNIDYDKKEINNAYKGV